MCGEHGDALWNFKVWFIREVFHSFAAQEPKHLLDDAGVFFRIASELTEEAIRDEEKDSSEEEAIEEIFKFSTLALLISIHRKYGSVRCCGLTTMSTRSTAST